MKQAQLWGPSEANKQTKIIDTETQEIQTEINITSRHPCTQTIGQTQAEKQMTNQTCRYANIIYHAGCPTTNNHINPPDQISSASFLVLSLQQFELPSLYLHPPVHPAAVAYFSPIWKYTTQPLIISAEDFQCLYIISFSELQDLQEQLCRHCVVSGTQPANQTLRCQSTW